MPQYVKLPDSNYVAFPDDWTPARIDAQLRKDAPELMKGVPVPTEAAGSGAVRFSETQRAQANQRETTSAGRPPPPQNPYVPEPLKELPAGEFMKNSVLQGAANLGGFAGLLGTFGQEDVGGALEQQLGVQKDVTTSNPLVKFAGRTVENAVGAAPFAALGPLGYLGGSALSAAGGMAGEAAFGPGGRLPGEIVGGFTPTGWVASGVRAATPGIKSARQYIKDQISAMADADALLADVDPTIRGYANTKAAGTVAGAFDSNPKAEELLSNMQAYLDRVEQLTGKRPEVTLGEMLDDVNLKDITKKQAKTTPEGMNAAEARFNQNTEILDAAREKAVGSADDTAILRDITSGAEQKTRELMGTIEGLKQRYDDIVAGLGDTNQSIAGAQTRNIIASAKKNEAGRQTVLADKLLETYGAEKFDVTPVLTRVDELAKELSPMLDQAKMPRLLQNIQKLKEHFAVGGSPGRGAVPAGAVLDDLGRPVIAAKDAVPASKPTGYQASLEDTWTMLKELGEDIGEAQAGRVVSGPVLKKLHDIEDAILEQALGSPVTPGGAAAAEELANFRSGYKTNYIQRFRQGSVRESLMKNPDGTFGKNNEQLTREFLKSDTGMQKLLAAVGDDKEAMQLFDDSVMGLFVKDLMPNGQDPTKGQVNRWLEKNKHLGTHRPELYKKLSTTGPDLIDINRQIAAKGQEIVDLENSGMVKLAKDGKGFALIKDAVKNPSAMSKLLIDITPESRQAVKNIILDLALGQKNSPDKVLEFFSDPAHAKSLRQLFAKDDQGLKDALSISYLWHAMSDPKTYGGVTSAALTETPWAATLRKYGVSHAQLTSAARAMQRGQGSIPYWGMIFGYQGVNKVVQDQMVDQITDIQKLILKDPSTRKAVLDEIMKNGPKIHAEGKLGLIKRFAKLIASDAATTGVQRSAIIGSQYMGQKEEPAAWPPQPQ